MDAALIIGGVVDTVHRNKAASDMPAHQAGQWVDAPEGDVFGGFLYTNGEFVAPSVDPAVAAERIKRAIVEATQAALDAFAQTRNYSGIMSACTYVSSTNPTFAAEGAYCVELRDQTWAKLYEMLAEVQAGTRPIPSSYADIAPELPVTSAAWPN